MAMAAAGRRLASGGRLLPPALSRPRPAAPAFGRPNLTKGFSSHGKGKEEGRDVLEQIQEKKERLYDLILYHRGYKRNDGSTCYANVQLMHHLSAHVKPRPQSIAWRYLQKVHSFYILWMCLSPAVSAYAIWNIYKAGGISKSAARELAHDDEVGNNIQGGDELGKNNS